MSFSAELRCSVLDEQCSKKQGKKEVARLLSLQYLNDCGEPGPEVLVRRLWTTTQHHYWTNDEYLLRTSFHDLKSSQSALFSEVLYFAILIYLGSKQDVCFWQRDLIQKGSANSCMLVHPHDRASSATGKKLVWNLHGLHNERQIRLDCSQW